MRSECSIAVLVKFLRAKLWRLHINIEAVHQHYLWRIFSGSDIIRSVSTEHTKSFVVCRNIKLFSQGNHHRADLDHSDVGPSKLLIAPLRYRASTQPNYCDAFGGLVKEQEGHHGSGIGEHKKIWIAHKHLALDLADLKLHGHTVAFLIDVRTNLAKLPLIDAIHLMDQRQFLHLLRPNFLCKLPTK